MKSRAITRCPHGLRYGTHSYRIRQWMDDVQDDATVRGRPTVFSRKTSAPATVTKLLTRTTMGCGVETIAKAGWLFVVQ